MKQKPKLWDSLRERKKKKERERELFPQRLEPKALLAGSQNKGLSEYQRRASWLEDKPIPRWRQRGRQAIA